MAPDRLAVVLGSSAAALDELTAARELLDAHAIPLRVVCVNDSIKASPVKPVAFCTIHSIGVPDRFIAPDLDIAGVAMFTAKPVHGFASRAVRAKWRGTSGLYAAQIALEELKFDGVILAGVPQDVAAGANATHARGESQTWADDDFVARMRREWLRALPEIKGRVRSMSGWTRELLSAPDADWLASLSVGEAAA